MTPIVGSSSRWRKQPTIGLAGFGLVCLLLAPAGAESRPPAESAAVLSESSDVPTGEESAGALRLLRPEGERLTGEVRFRTVAGREDIERAVFRLDGTIVAESSKAPFSAVIDLGDPARPTIVSVVAYSATGQRLCEDSLEINTLHEPPVVSISTLELDREAKRLRIGIDASRPAGLAPERIEIYLNHDRRATLVEAPFEIVLGVGSLTPADVVRVLAHYEDGHSAEAARLAMATGPGDVLEVNVVELLAVVSPRGRKSRLELGREDFRIRQEQRRLPVDHFSASDEVPLTLGLVVDTSQSMRHLLADVRQAGERFVAEAVRARDEVFVVDFSRRPRLAEATTHDPIQLRRTMADLEAGGDTALYDAIVFSLQQFVGRSGRRALVVLTDGEDSASLYGPADCLRQARVHGVPIYIISLGAPPQGTAEPWLLRAQMIARRSGGEIFYTTDSQRLPEIYERIGQQLQRQFYLAFNAGRPLSPAELEQIEVEAIPKGLSVRTLLASQQGGG